MLLFRVMPVFIVSCQVFAVPIYNEKYSYYNIYGTSEKELRQQMLKLGPLGYGSNNRHYDASTTWGVAWNYSFKASKDHLCYITKVKVTLNVTYQYPNWVNEDMAEPRLQKKWDSYLVSLANHEHGHAVNGEGAANEIEQSLLSLSGLESCDSLEEIAEARAYKIIANHNTKDILYDERTAHGVSQGAAFP